MLDLLFPPCCALCRHRGEVLCRNCLEGLPVAPDLAPPPGLTDFAALFTYEGPTRDLIAAIKFRNHRESVPYLGWIMSGLVREDVEVVTWAPTSRRRRRERGYDQAELLARAVGRALKVPVRELLRREPGHSQTGLGRYDRLHGPKFQPAGPTTGPVLLVDDIRTTGSTLSTAADVLTESGSTSVAGLTLAVAL